MVDTGLPGRPKIGLPPAAARIVGLPGWIDTPWTSTPGRPSSPITCAVMSRVLTELPAEMISMSAVASASAAIRRSDAGVVGRDAGGQRLAAGAAGQRGDRVGVDVAHLPGQRLLLGRHDLVAGRQDRHARARGHRHRS